MSVPGPPDIPRDAGAGPGAPGVIVNADARLALATAYVGMWGERDLESARGVWVTDVPALATRATPAAGKAISAAEGCAKALPKQDKQTTMSKARPPPSRRRGPRLEMTGLWNFPPP